MFNAIRFLEEDALTVIVIFVGNRICDPSSNPQRGFFISFRSNVLGKEIYLSTPTNN